MHLLRDVPVDSDPYIIQVTADPNLRANFAQKKLKKNIRPRL